MADDENIFKYTVSGDAIAAYPLDNTIWMAADQAAQKYAEERGLVLDSATSEYKCNGESSNFIITYTMKLIPKDPPKKKNPLTAWLDDHREKMRLNPAFGEDHAYLASQMHGSDIYEVAPTPNNYPAVWDLVIEDMQKRDTMGVKKYGTHLQPFNNRDALWDAYQEALDLVVYLRQAIYEREIGEK